MNAEDVLSEWHSGWLTWSIIYYASGFLAISLPAIFAAGFPSDEKHRRMMSAAIAIVIATVTWIQPGFRVTKKAEGFACLRELIATETYEVKGEYQRCSDLYNYTYVDVQSPTKIDNAHP